MQSRFFIALMTAVVAECPALIYSQTAHAQPASRVDTITSPIFLARNKYFAKTGKSDEVYAWRKHASDVLADLHLHNGRVLRGPGGDEPDAIWEIELDSATLIRESRVAAASPEFQAVMQHMGTLVRRFESATYRRRRLFVDSGAVGTTAPDRRETNPELSAALADWVAIQRDEWHHGRPHDHR